MGEGALELGRNTLRFMESLVKNGVDVAYAQNLGETCERILGWARSWRAERFLIGGLSVRTREALRETLSILGRVGEWVEIFEAGRLEEYREGCLGVFRARHGLAETGGLVVLDDESNIASLVPAYSVALVEEGEIVESYASLSTILRSERIGGLSIISGPSGTSDIELTHVKGVHGPLEVGCVVAGFDLDE